MKQYNPINTKPRRFLPHLKEWVSSPFLYENFCNQAGIRPIEKSGSSQPADSGIAARRSFEEWIQVVANFPIGGSRTGCIPNNPETTENTRMTTTAETKNRPRTLATALELIEQMEEQITGLNSALAKATEPEPTKAQNLTSPSAPVATPSVKHSPPAANQQPAQPQPLTALSARDLTLAIDEAQNRGATEEVNRLYKELTSRRRH